MSQRIKICFAIGCIGGVLANLVKYMMMIGLFGVVGVDFSDWLTSSLLTDGSLEGGLKLALGARGPVRAPPMFSCCRL